MGFGAKTKLLCYSSKSTSDQAGLQLATTPVFVDGQAIHPTPQAAHVGVVRAEDNSAHIMDRVAAHRRAVYAILHGGSARGHRANPAASLRVEKVLNSSVLLSGIAGIILTNKEEKLLDQL